MATKIQIRRDTLANWNSNDPVLSSGEIGFITDENKFKVGNGSSVFSLLPYLQADAYVDSVQLGTETTGNYVAQVTGSGDGISVTGSGESASVVISNTGVTSLAGTTNEVEVSASTGSIILSLPSTINANTTGSAATLTNARVIELSGDVSGSVTFDGSASVNIATTIQPNSVALGTDTTGNYVAQVTGSGDGISVTGSGESASVVISNTGVTSLAGTTNEVEVSASTGSIILSLPSTINANTTGSAATLTNARVIELSGDVSGSVTFDGSASVNIATTIQPNSVALGTDTTGNYVATIDSGPGISVSGSGSENAATTITNTGIISLSGTSNQISVSASNGDATLSFPSAVIFPGTVTLNANPEQALEAATKQYVDSVSQGLNVHDSVQAATTASVDLSNPPATIDGVTLINNIRILVKDQSDSSENGIYVYNSASAILTRASDFDSIQEIEGGDFVFVTGGNTYDNTGWVQTENITTVGTDPVLWTQFSGAGTYLAGTGLALDGSTFSNTGVLSIQGTEDEITISASSGAVTISLPTTINASITGSAATLTTSRTIELLGDVTGSASFNGGSDSSITSTLANTAVSPASYGSASAVGIFTVDSKGRLTAASNTAIAISQSAVTDLVNDLSAKAPLASPALTGTPTAPTAAVDTNTTQIATTAFVIGQDYLKTSTASATYAPLASPALTGTPTAPTAAVDTNTTQIATTAYVIGQSYLKSSTASSTYAPLASPALTGTPTAPTAAYDDDSTQIATTEYVQHAIERITINTQTSSYALDLADAGEVVEMNSASANTVTVPLNSTKAFPIGSTIDIVQYGAGQTTIAGESVGVTIRSKENKLKLTSQYSAATLYKRGTDEWIVFGDLTS